MTDNEDSGVLGSLPATRPTRLGGERRERAKRAATGAAARKPATRKPAARKPANGRASRAKPRTTTAKPRTTTAQAGGPRAVRAGAPELEASTERAKHAAEPPPAAPPSGAELVTTAFQAAGELAQLGLTVGGQILKRAAEKLPKP